MAVQATVCVITVSLLSVSFIKKSLVMSHDENTKWLESSREMFDEALLEGNHSLALSIALDVKDKGFTTEFETLQAIYAETLKEEAYE